MIRVVLDANAIVSGVVRFRTSMSPPVKIIRAWFDNQFELCVSDALIDEVTRTLSKPWFLARVEPDLRDLALSALREFATQTELSHIVPGVATHPEDDLVLATAYSANAVCLGDKQLLTLGGFRGITILSPRDFWEFLNEARETLI